MERGKKRGRGRSHARKFTFGTSGVTDVDEVEVSTVVYVPPEEIYEFLVDFPRYADYSKHLRALAVGRRVAGHAVRPVLFVVEAHLHRRSEVTDVSPPTRIDWRIVKDIDADGYWAVEPDPDDFGGGQTAPGAMHVASTRRRPQTARSAVPRSRSVTGFATVKPLIRKEATDRRRVVADLDGGRDVDGVMPGS
ncbi:polyketide cyclase [Haloferax sp. wsp5]|nr:polyketide cyclase [Haloferax sp. wsp5]